MKNRRDLEAIAGSVIDLVKRAAPTAEVSVTARSERASNVRFGANEIESCGDVDDDSLRIQVAFGLRHAQVSTNQTDDAALQAIVRRVVSMAKVAPEDPERMPLLPAQVYAPVPDAYDSAMVDMSSEARASAAAVGITAARQGRLNGAGFLELTGGEVVHANSAGLRAGHRSTFGSLSMTARTQDATGSGWASRASHLGRDLDVGAVAKTASDKALRSASARPLEPGKYTVVLEPAAVAGLLEFLPHVMFARNVDEGRSALSKPGGGNRLGEAVASPIVTLRSDPANPEIPTAPFDEHGMPMKPITWLDRGVLSALAYSRYWAQKKGKEATDWENLHLTGGEAKSIDELVAGVKRGLLVTRFWYIRVLDPHEASVTGLTRDGLFLIEDGKVTNPVNNFRFNQSVLGLLKSCEAMTRETWRVTNEIRVPALRAADFNMASVSAAV